MAPGTRGTARAAARGRRGGGSGRTQARPRRDRGLPRRRRPARRGLAGRRPRARRPGRMARPPRRSRARPRHRRRAVAQGPPERAAAVIAAEGDPAVAMAITNPRPTMTGTAVPARTRPDARTHQDDAHSGVHGATRWGTLALSLGALGVVYGDVGTSPLYTVQLIFTGDHPMVPSPLRVYGALSLIFWALTLIVTLKYVLLILRVDNHGEGGIMALVEIGRASCRERV